MKTTQALLYSILFWLASLTCLGQNVALFQQFNGRYDFTVVGNTLNPQENNPYSFCTIFNTSSESLNLLPTDQVEKAFIYWAGSGTGDFEIKLNGEIVNSERDFPVFQNELDYFSAYADVTSIVQANGNGLYTVSELDLQTSITGSQYCVNRTNFGGWAILIIFKNENLPLNQLNIYDGLQAVSINQNTLTLTLNDLNVLDNLGAKLGFIAWEGDATLANQETFKFNGFDLTNDLNPLNNAFNSTNSFTGSNQLYNMDLDVYDIESFIQVGNPTATIELKSIQDFVMISTVISKLNNQLPDATIAFESPEIECNSGNISVNYTVFNVNSTDVLPAGIPVSVFANDIYITSFFTQNVLAIGESESGSIGIQIPNTIPADFELKFIVDQNENGIGIQKELNENNNSFSALISLYFFETPVLNNVKSCNLGFTKALFDFSGYENLAKINPEDEVLFYESETDAALEQNPITNFSQYEINEKMKEIFVRVNNERCYQIYSFFLVTKNCPPTIYNLVTANNDGANDTFYIEGLREIFVNFKLEIYNRWGNLIWEGDNQTEDWNGFATKGPRIMGDKVTPGTYYYILNLNDSDYSKPLTGFIHLTN
ncbi:gliding motility-associated C-terminal domain-containing protein [Flavobacterium antarcticum]|uniref:T9SS type B sorting domain-containing protein n=1 Tax=Flavobacterium antarcticum TaxID=271155 RepID=UPI0003B32048|nr:gliding motility-associated C-terminal domain-containing protein [Flavobacterium antarcticum]